MKMQRLPNWLLELKGKMTRCKIYMAFTLCFSVVAFILGAMAADDYLPGVFIAGFPISMFCSIFGWIGLCGTKIRYRKIEGYYVCLYCGVFKNYLIIEDEVHDSACFEHYYYGELPNGTKITVKLDVWGGILFAVGDSQNLNLTKF